MKKFDAFAWGFKRTLFSSDKLFVDLLIIKPGGYSSVHTHANLFNEFTWVEGELLIREYLSSNLQNPKHSIKLDAFVYPTIVLPPGCIHQFYNPTRTFAKTIEISYVGNADRSDIERFSERGCDIK